MIDWLKYFPWQLRMAPESASFKGPSFDNAKPVILVSGGNTIRLRAPRHSTHHQEHQIYLKGEEGMEYGSRSFHRVATDNWRYLRLFFRSWTYRFEWFGGAAGDLSINVNILSRKEGMEFQGTSFFYPRVFEHALTNYLSTRYGFKWDGTEFIKRAPLNWKTHHHLPVSSCSFELMDDDDPMDMFFMFPLTDRHIVEIHFFHTTGRDEVLKEMWSLARQIIDSVQLELSPASQMELARVKSDIGELSLTEEFAPLKWPVEVGEIESAPIPLPTLTRV